MLFETVSSIDFGSQTSCHSKVISMIVVLDPVAFCGCKMVSIYFQEQVCMYSVEGRCTVTWLKLTIECPIFLH